MLGKVVIISQHYPPDRSTTAGIISAIAEHLATEGRVLILSGTPGSATNDSSDSSPLNRPTVVEIKNWMPAKAALLRRAAAELSFMIRAFLALLSQLQRGDVVLTVIAPFTLP